MNNDTKKSIAAITIGASILVGGDVMVLGEAQAQANTTIAGENVIVGQRDNVVVVGMPWKGEIGLTITKDLGTPSPAERMRDKRKQEAVIDNSTFGEGGIKFDIILNEKPTTNRFCYNVTGWDDYNWYYQPELTPEEIADGASRPENIVGSYAVYHKTLKNNEYKTGKAFHIERPSVWEVNNKEATTEWAELSFDEGDLCVTARQGFLDEAEYPVRIDPTFGYESVGGTQLFSPHSGSPNNSIVGSFFSVGESADISSVTFYGYISCSGLGCSARSGRGGVYDNSLNFEGGTNEAALPSTAGWTSFNYATDLPVASATYGVTIFGKSTLSRPGVDSSSLVAYYDSGTTGQGVHTYSGLTYPTWPDPLSNSCADFGVCDAQFSIYATYTASGGGGGGGTTSPPPVILFD